MAAMMALVCIVAVGMMKGEIPQESGINLMELNMRGW